jgi:hypothetical protein
MHLPPLFVVHLKPHFRLIWWYLGYMPGFMFIVYNLRRIYNISVFAYNGLNQMRIYVLTEVIRQTAVMYLLRLKTMEGLSRNFRIFVT